MNPTAATTENRNTKRIWTGSERPSGLTRAPRSYRSPRGLLTGAGWLLEPGRPKRDVASMDHGRTLFFERVSRACLVGAGFYIGIL